MLVNGKFPISVRGWNGQHLIDGVVGLSLV